MKVTRDSWRFAVKPEIHFGNNAVKDVGKHVNGLGCKKVFIVTDKILSEVGILGKVIEPLKKENIEFEIFDGGEPEPKVSVAEKAIKAAEGKGIDAVIGLGGGSNMDIGKVVAIVLTYGGDMRDYMGEGKVPGPIMPVIAIPTTAGTGSELSYGAVLTDPETKLKQVYADDFIRPIIAIEDPLLTLTMPPKATANTGVDALCHAIEAYTTLDFSYMAPDVEKVTTYGAFPISNLLALEAIKQISHYLPIAFFQGNNVEARGGQMLGALYATLAFSTAGANLNHTLGYPVAGAGAKMNHGESNAIFMLHTMEFNVPASLEKFKNIAVAMGESIDGLSLEEAAYRSLVPVKRLLKKVGMTMNLKDLGVDKRSFPEFAEAVMKMQRLLRNNPRKVTFNDVVEIYEKAYDYKFD